MDLIVSTPAYPDTIPGPSHFSFKPVQQVIRTEEFGPKAFRRRTRDLGSLASVTFRFTRNEYQIFLNWFRADLLYGNRKFTIDLPSAGGQISHIACFDKRPMAKLLGHTVWEVTGELEIVERRLNPPPPPVPPTFHAPLTTNQFDIVAPVGTLAVNPVVPPTFGPLGATFAITGAANFYWHDAGNKLEISEDPNRGLWEYSADITFVKTGTGGNGDQIKFFVAGLQQYGFSFRVVNSVLTLWCFADAATSINTGLPLTDGHYSLLVDTRQTRPVYNTKWYLNGVLLRTAVYEPVAYRYVWIGPQNGNAVGVSSITIKDVKATKLESA
jgi:hypothetical protein